MEMPQENVDWATSEAIEIVMIREEAG